MTSAAMDTVRRIAATGLAGPHGVPDEVISIDTTHNDRVLHLLREHRLEGVAVAAMASGGLETDSDFSVALVQRHDETMVQTLRVEIATIEVSTLLTDHGITHRLLKGAALAHTAVPAPSERPFRDVDVLVESSSIDDAVAMLEFEGARRLRPQLRDGFDARFAKSVTLSNDDVEIDIHRLLTPGPFGVWMKPGDLFLLGSTLELAGSSLPTLDETEHLVHACYHAALGSRTPALINLRDIALLAQGEWDSERFAQMISRWRGTAVVRRAVGLVVDQLAIELPAELASYRSIAVDQIEANAVEPYMDAAPEGRFAALAPATLRALPMSERPAFALAVGLPDGASPIGRLRSLVDRVR